MNFIKSKMGKIVFGAGTLVFLVLLLVFACLPVSTGMTYKANVEGEEHQIKLNADHSCVADEEQVDGYYWVVKDGYLFVVPGTSYETAKELVAEAAVEDAELKCNAFTLTIESMGESYLCGGAIALVAIFGALFVASASLLAVSYLKKK